MFRLSFRGARGRRQTERPAIDTVLDALINKSVIESFLVAAESRKPYGRREKEDYMELLKLWSKSPQDARRAALAVLKSYLKDTE